MLQLEEASVKLSHSWGSLPELTGVEWGRASSDGMSNNRVQGYWRLKGGLNHCLENEATK